MPYKLPCEMLKWLPDPLLAEDGDRFKKYNEVIISISYFSKFEELTHFRSLLYVLVLKSKDTETEKDCPSLIPHQKKKKSVPGKQVPVQVTSSIAVRNADGEVREPSTSTSLVFLLQFLVSFCFLSCTVGTYLFALVSNHSSQKCADKSFNMHELFKLLNMHN